jgi:hypothetical protein
LCGGVVSVGFCNYFLLQVLGCSGNFRQLEFVIFKSLGVRMWRNFGILKILVSLMWWKFVIAKFWYF